eukprot:3140849-Rhodomonas_salina.1
MSGVGAYPLYGRVILSTGSILEYREARDVDCAYIGFRKHDKNGSDLRNGGSTSSKIVGLPG